MELERRRLRVRERASPPEAVGLLRVPRRAASRLAPAGRRSLTRGRERGAGSWLMACLRWTAVRARVTCMEDRISISEADRFPIQRVVENHGAKSPGLEGAAFPNRITCYVQPGRREMRPGSRTFASYQEGFLLDSGWQSRPPCIGIRRLGALYTMATSFGLAPLVRETGLLFGWIEVRPMATALAAIPLLLKPVGQLKMAAGPLGRQLTQLLLEAARTRRGLGLKALPNRGVHVVASYPEEDATRDVVISSLRLKLLQSWCRDFWACRAQPLSLRLAIAGAA